MEQFVPFIQALGQLGVFSMFVMAIIEVFKDVSAKGVFRLLREIFGSLFGLKDSDGTKIRLSVEAIKTMNFVVSMFLCAVFKYGVMVKVLQVDTNGSDLAAFTDYFGTSAVVYYGADKMYDRVLAWIAKYKKSSGGTS